MPPTGGLVNLASTSSCNLFLTRGIVWFLRIHHLRELPRSLQQSTSVTVHLNQTKWSWSMFLNIDCFSERKKFSRAESRRISSFTSPGAIDFELHTWKLSGRTPPSCDPPWELYTSLAGATSTFGSRWMLSSPPLRVLPQSPCSECTCSHSSTLALATSDHGPQRKTWASGPSPSSDQAAWVSIPPAGWSSQAQSSSCLRCSRLLARSDTANSKRSTTLTTIESLCKVMATQSIGTGSDRVYMVPDDQHMRKIKDLTS